MTAKILLVDDEAAVLAGYERTLHNEFEVDTAIGGELALNTMRERGPYAVVVSDMRMPGMNGAQFLGKARQATPDTVRMLLTGYTDLGAAMEAVNEGNIFRFLTKPCAKEVLVAAIHSGVEQYQLIRTEKELLEKTLVGCIKVLADFLSAASPEAFGRSTRIGHIVRHIASKFSFEFLWRLEAAATLSQLGCITLDTDLLQRAFGGTRLPAEDQARFDAHPEAAMRLLTGIPRLEPTAWMIGQQLIRDIPMEVPDLPAASMQETLLGAKILKLAVSFDNLQLNRMSNEHAVSRLRGRSREFEPELVSAVSSFKVEARKMEARTLPACKLATGMVLDQELRNKEDLFLAAKGQEITRAVLIKLQNFARAGLIEAQVKVLAPM
jgi:response regulator RpfG family c-di-GMP phosphodiesterase